MYRARTVPFLSVNYHFHTCIQIFSIFLLIDALIIIISYAMVKAWMKNTLFENTNFMA